MSSIGIIAGGVLSGGLGELVDRFKQSGHGETAESWVRTGPNKQTTPSELERVVTDHGVDDALVYTAPALQTYSGTNAGGPSPRRRTTPTEPRRRAASGPGPIHR